MNKDLAVWKQFLDLAGYFMTQAMGLIHSAPLRHEQMHVDLADMAGLAGAQLVVLQHLSRMAFEHVEDELLFVVRELDIEDVEKGFSGEVISGLYDHERHTDGDQRVQQVRAGK